MIYRKETSFTCGVEDPLLYDVNLFVKGIYYYAPNEEYGEPPNIFIQNDSKLIIQELVDIYCKDFMYKLNDSWYLNQIEELVWEQLLSEDE